MGSGTVVTTAIIAQALPDRPTMCAIRDLPGGDDAPVALSETAPGSAWSLEAFYEDVDRGLPPDLHRVEVQLDLLDVVVRPLGRRLQILDVGCGDGTITAQAARRAQPADAVGVDWARSAVDAAARQGVKAVRTTVDGGGLPFAPGSFDVVLMSEVIEHLVDPDLALAEARRVLAPGGTLLLSTPNLAAWFNRVLLLAGVQPVFSEVSRLGVFGRPGSQVVGHLRLFTARALTEVLVAHGFTAVRLVGAGYHDVPRGARALDRLLARRAGIAGILVASARAPGPERPPERGAGPERPPERGAGSPRGARGAG
ncbi:MAG TPA: class I SAM-dependent methyltransferase [Acidimicrobiales bacterium]|nr:class I SAM-dependent methyltransferase [Acidimicrobiales bacterium]